MSINQILDTIVSSYILSAERNGFNGLVASALSEIVENAEILKCAIAKLILDEKVTAIFSCIDANMHIKRHSDIIIPKQLELLQSERLNTFCLYPTDAEIRNRVDLAKWQNRPFSKALLLTEPQLAFRAFEMSALERYVADPRYSFKFNDYMGWMSIKDESYSNKEYPERDKVSLQSFGLGFDLNRIPYTIVYLRYLSSLSAEHQQYWHSYMASGEIRMSKPYYYSSIKGEYWKNCSVRHAITEEMQLIRVLCEAIWGGKYFSYSR